MKSKKKLIFAICTLFINFVAWPVLASPLAYLSVLPLSDPRASIISGQDFIDNAIQAGYDAEIFFENVSLTDFTNATVLVKLIDGEQYSGPLGNIGPAHVNPYFGYPVAAFNMFSWDSIVSGARGHTYQPRPVSITFMSEQSIPVTLAVTAPYDSVAIVPVPEPSTGLLLFASIVGFGMLWRKLRTEHLLDLQKFSTI